MGIKKPIYSLNSLYIGFCFCAKLVYIFKIRLFESVYIAPLALSGSPRASVALLADGIEQIPIFEFVQLMLWRLIFVARRGEFCAYALIDKLDDFISKIKAAFFDLNQVAALHTVRRFYIIAANANFSARASVRSLSATFEDAHRPKPFINPYFVDSCIHISSVVVRQYSFVSRKRINASKQLKVHFAVSGIYKFEPIFKLCICQHARKFHLPAAFALFGLPIKKCMYRQKN